MDYVWLIRYPPQTSGALVAVRTAQRLCCTLFQDQKYRKRSKILKKPLAECNSSQTRSILIRVSNYEPRMMNRLLCSDCYKRSEKGSALIYHTRLAESATMRTLKSRGNLFPYSLLLRNLVGPLYDVLLARILFGFVHVRGNRPEI